MAAIVPVVGAAAASTLSNVLVVASGALDYYSRNQAVIDATAHQVVEAVSVVVENIPRPPPGTRLRGTLALSGVSSPPAVSSVSVPGPEASSLLPFSKRRGIWTPPKVKTGSFGGFYRVFNTSSRRVRRRNRRYRYRRL